MSEEQNKIKIYFKKGKREDVESKGSNLDSIAKATRTKAFLKYRITKYHSEVAQVDASLIHYYKKNQEKVTAKSELQDFVIITNRNKTREPVWCGD